MESNDFISKCINAIRFLSADGVQEANSGHPGLPMGTAAIAYTLWSRHLRFDPLNPEWPNRDRFILSGGHGSMLLYSLLYLTGFAVPMAELKNFRKWGSITPGHPEYGLTPGVETTTGPLGQGFANGVGMAIAEAHLAAIYNKPGYDVIDHYTFALVTDGDLMEGVTSEAASLAGHLCLGKMIYLYDDNRISIDGSTDLAFTEDRAARFSAYGWHVQTVDDGNDVEKIDKAIIAAKKDKRPSIIMCRTHIGYGLPTRQDTSKAHGEPPGEDELNSAKKNLGWPQEPRFYCPEDVLSYFRKIGERGKKSSSDWDVLFGKYKIQFPKEYSELDRRLKNVLPDDWDSNLPTFDMDPKGMATRVASGKTLNAIANRLPELVGGSADLTPSNNTMITGATAFQANNYSGRYFHFGVRENGMGSIVNGMAYHKGLIPYSATFLVFTDYMRPALRLSALSHLPSIWLMTHDSIGLGEDGPTHQPVEHLASLRAIPNLVVLRPADANEVVEAWRVAIKRSNSPTLIALTRQNLPIFDRRITSPASGLQNGAYVLADLGKGEPELILMASGSEVSLVYDAGKRLASEGINIRIVSFPSWELFKAQDKSYQDSVLLPAIQCRIAVETGISQGWERWVGDKGKIIAMDRYGASAPYQVLFEKFGFTVENVYQQSKVLLDGRS